MTLTPPEEPPLQLSAERPVRSDYARPGLSYATRRVMTVIVSLVFIGSIAYLAYGRMHRAAPQDIPTIKAETNVKQRPEQPGGIDIPHQDVQVYQELDAKNAAKPQVEHLLPPPEAPQASSSAAPVTLQTLRGGSNAEPAVPPVPKMESLLAPPPPIETTVTVTEPAPASSPPSAPIVVDVTPSQSTPSEPAPKVVQIAPVAPAQTPAPTPKIIQIAPAATPPAPAAKTEPKTVTVPINEIMNPDGASMPAAAKTAKQTSKPVAGGPAVQLASVPDEANAHHMMAELESKYADTLGGVKLHVVRADLGSKGVYYRIQSQRVSKEQAEQICASIKKQNAGCIIVHP